MLRHATGYVLANKGTDTRTLQGYAPPDQRLDILKFNAKDDDIIGSGHTASFTASGLRRNQSPSAAQ
jgi:hypothetical protein